MLLVEITCSCNQFSKVPEFTSDFKIDTTSSFRQCPNLLAISILMPLVEARLFAHVVIHIEGDLVDDKGELE